VGSIDGRPAGVEALLGWEAVKYHSRCQIIGHGRIPEGLQAASAKTHHHGGAISGKHAGQVGLRRSPQETTSLLRIQRQ